VRVAVACAIEAVRPLQKIVGKMAASRSSLLLHQSRKLF